MRKSWSAFAILMVAVAFGPSTVSAAEKPTFGVVGGLHLTNLAIDPEPTDVGLDSLTRANIGGFAEFDIAPNLLFQARAMYVRKGARLEERVEDVGIRAETTIDYITVPALLKIRPDTAKIRPYALVGPELGFKTGSRASLSTDPPMPMDLVGQVEEELNQQVKDNVSSIDVALDFGGGIEFPARGMSFLVEGIYSLGLRNIDTDGEGHAKTKTFLFNVGIRF
jgi:hypothetical protein